MTLTLLAQQWIRKLQFQRVRSGGLLLHLHERWDLISLSRADHTTPHNPTDPISLAAAFAPPHAIPVAHHLLLDICQRLLLRHVRSSEHAPKSIRQLSFILICSSASSRPPPSAGTLQAWSTPTQPALRRPRNLAIRSLTSSVTRTSRLAASLWTGLPAYFGTATTSSKIAPMHLLNL